MAPSLFSSFVGSSQTCALDDPNKSAPNKTTDKELAKSLPAVVYRDDNWFQLERRAIFSKLWILASHTSRFDKPGDYIVQTYAGYSYFIIKNKEGGFKAFHNVCRHRAFPVLGKEAGNASIIACKYHSWSYRYDGSLIKAPKLDNDPAFKKDQNSLFPVHVHITDKGFIFVNFAAGEPISFDKHFGALPAEWAKLPVDEYEYSPEASWVVTGKYNWKSKVCPAESEVATEGHHSALMDGYQECYHCQIGHPGFAKTLDLAKYDVVPFTNFARHQVPNSTPDDENPPSFTFTFPNTGVTTCPQMWYMMRCVPVDAHTTRMEYDVYRHKSLSVQELKEFMLFYEQVEKEDFDLCEATQRGLEAGIYSKGTLHPKNENGVLYYHQLVLNHVEAHRAAENAAGTEIHPATPLSQKAGPECAASTLCASLGEDKGVLAW